MRMVVKDFRLRLWLALSKWAVNSLEIALFDEGMNILSNTAQRLFQSLRLNTNTRNAGPFHPKPHRTFLH
jgi:hypothetical protein